MRLEAPRSLRRPLALTPLIDVVFLLLLFFMLASTFQKYGEIDLTTAGTGAGTQSEDRPLLLRLHADGSIDLNARTIAFEDLESALRAAMDDGKVKLLVQVKPETPTQNMVDVLERVRGLGIDKVMVSR